MTSSSCSCGGDCPKCTKCDEANCECFCDLYDEEDGDMGDFDEEDDDFDEYNDKEDDEDSDYY